MLNFSQCLYNYSKKSHILVLTNAISTYPNFSLNMSDLINFARFVTKRIEIVSKVVLRPRDRVTVWVKIVSKVVFRLRGRVTVWVEIVSKVMFRPRGRVTVWVEIVSKVVFRP